MTFQDARKALKVSIADLAIAGGTCVRSTKYHLEGRSVTLHTALGYCELLRKVNRRKRAVSMKALTPQGLFSLHASET